MIDQTLFHYQLECSQISATIYIGGETCSSRHIGHVAKVMNDLPRSMRVLRVDLHAVASMDLQTLLDLRAIMARWRTERNANVRLVLRSPLPREEWPTSAIQFERAPLRLVEPSRSAELIAMVVHRRRGTPSAQRVVARPQPAVHLHLTSAGAL